MIRGLKKEVHLLRKKLKKVEADLQFSRKNASKATREITRLHGLHIKDAVSFSIQKGSFEKEITELKRNSSDKSWALTAKNLKKTKKKIYLLEGSSSGPPTRPGMIGTGHKGSSSFKNSCKILRTGTIATE